MIDRDRSEKELRKKRRTPPPPQKNWKKTIERKELEMNQKRIEKRIEKEFDAI